MEGLEIGSWKIESKLGEGGMGEVFLARHQSLGTVAAVKALFPILIHDPKLIERFSQEARTQAQLHHPNIARVIDFLQNEERWYLVIEYVSRGSLSDRLDVANGLLPIEQALRWGCQSLRALDHAHQKGIIHRDVKPSNLLLDEYDRIKVTDFGIARVVGNVRLTTTGESLGTPQYMSPEQIRRPQSVDHRTDVYSMGLVLYEMLTGRVPFDSDSEFDIKQMQVAQAPRSPRELNEAVPEELSDLLLKALAKDPDDRFSGCGAFARAIEEFQSELSPPVPPPPDPEVIQRPITPPSKRTSAVWSVILGLALLACIILMVVFLARANKQKEKAARWEQKYTTTHANLLEVTETKEALEGRLAELVLLNEARSWPVKMVETFDQNTKGWGTLPSSEWGITRSVLLGNMIMTTSGLKDVIASTTSSDLPTIPGNFYLEIHGKNVADTLIGIVLFYDFRSIDDSKIFVVYHNRFLVQERKPGTVKTLVSGELVAGSVKKGQYARLTIVGRGSEVNFFLDDQHLAKFSDERRKKGSLALGIDANAGQKGRVWIDEVILRGR